MSRTYHGGRAAKLRKAMRNATMEGMLASASDNFSAPYVTLFALALGATKTQIGLISSLTALMGNIMQLPMAVLTERYWRRKNWCMLSGVINRGLWIVIALIPFFASGPTAVWLFCALLTMRSLGASLGMPAWTALMADIAPRRVRGSYFAYRNIVLNISGLVATLTGGWLIRRLGAPLGFQASFFVAFVFGILAASMFARLEDPRQTAPMAAPGPAPQAPLRRRLSLLLGNLRQERLFLLYAFTAVIWNMGVSMPQPLFPVYFVNNLGGEAYLWGLASGTSMVSTLLGQRYWGPLSDRFGGHKIMVISGVVALSVPFMWWAVPDYRWVFAINAFTGFMWAGYNLAAFNLLLEITPDQRRATYVAGYNGLMGLATGVAPFIGGLLSDQVGIRPVLLLSFALRIAGWVLLATLVHPATDRPMDWRYMLPRVLRRAVYQRRTL